MTKEQNNQKPEENTTNSWHIKRRRSHNYVSKFVIPDNAIPSKREEHLSPSEKYRLIIQPYRTREGSWNITEGLVYNAKTDEFIAEVHRNYSHFPFVFVEDHPETGHDYLLCGENYQGQTIIELDTKKRKDYTPPAARNGWGFCWSSMTPSPNGKYLAVEGCYWACPYEIIIYDFSNPMQMPLPEICGNEENQEFFGWIDNDSCEIGYSYEASKASGKSEDDMTLEEIEELEKHRKENNLKYSDVWEEKREKIVFKVPAHKKLKFWALKEEIKKYARYGVSCRRIVQCKSEKEKNKWATHKREASIKVRNHLIAYCLLRNRDYYKMEPRVRPFQDNWFSFKLQCSQIYDIVQNYGTEEDREKWTEEKIREHLSYARRKEMGFA